MSTAPQAQFDPATIRTFQFTYRSMARDGLVRLGYALDDIEFEETMQLPVPLAKPPAVEGLLDLLHWVAGISYYKAAIPQHLVCETGAPPPAASRLLSALYSEGLGEFAVRNELKRLPHPQFPRASDDPPVPHRERTLERVLVPIGGGKDSAVAIEIARHSGLETTLFSLGDAPPISGTANAAGLRRHLVSRTIDAGLLELNERGALNGHVPITAIVSCVALLVAATQGLDAVLMANERSASAGNLVWNGIEINHQFSKSRRAERLLADAVAEIDGAPLVFSVLRPASELKIAAAFARLEQYHPVFTSCNRVFGLNPDERLSSWCGDCDKCRFVYLMLAPFMQPGALVEIFGADLLDEPEQYDGFALLAGTGGDKPFECVGEPGECLAAIELLTRRPEWQGHVNVKRLADGVLAEHPVSDAALQAHFALSDDHDIPDTLIDSVREVLGA